MLDKVYYKNRNEVILIYTHREPASLYNDDGNVIEMLDEFLAPLGSNCNTKSEFDKRVVSSSEDTQVIELDKVG